MNCKPGDLAVIIGFNPAYPHLTGRLVDVIELAPVGSWFSLPDGKSHRPSPAQSWVVRFHSPTDLTCLRGRAMALHGVCHDRFLKPIRDPGEDAQDETLQWLPVPVEGVPA